MSRYTEDIHAAVGALGQEPVGRPGIVVVVPDNYLPEPRPEGPGGVGDVPANAGFRSEILVGYYSTSDPNHGVELSDIWVRSATASGTIEVVRCSTASAFTDQPFVAGDAGWGKTTLRIFTKNTAAASTSDGTVVNTVGAATAGDWVKVLGIIRLRGRRAQTSVIFRPTADNRSIGVKFAYRELEKRSL